MYTSSVFGRDNKLEQIQYFSAYAKHRDNRNSKRPGGVKRHKDYIECLRTTGVKDVIGRFKPKYIECSQCNASNLHYEEKETDVAISVTLLELFHLNACDIAVLVTGDTDIAPSVRTAQRLFPDKEIAFAFPYKRKNEELRKLVEKSFNIRKERYAEHQFPDNVTLSNGRIINKPTSW